MLIVLLLATFVFSQSPTTAASASIPILEEAKRTCQNSVAVAKKKFLLAFDVRIRSAADDGDLKSVKLFMAAKAAAEVDCSVSSSIQNPSIIAAKARYDKDYNAAYTQLGAAYDDAIRNLTKARKFDKAETIQAEFNQSPQLSDLTIIAAPSHGNIWTDRLKLIDVKTDIVAGRWSMAADGLIETAPVKCARIVIPENTRGEYDLHAEFIRKAGAEDVNLFFPVGDSRVMLLLSGWKGTISGLDSVDGERPDVNETVIRRGLVKSGQTYSVDITVRLNQGSATISTKLNDAPLLV